MFGNTLFKERWYLIVGLFLVLTLLFSTYLPVTGRAVSQEGVSQPQVFSSSGSINFQGQLTDQGGNPLNGSYNMRFAIFDATSGGVKKWPSTDYEQHTGVAVDNGLFSVQLGSVGEPITSFVFSFVGDRYLQVWVCTIAGAGCTAYDEMGGRLEISSSAKAQSLTSPAYLLAQGSDTALNAKADNGFGVYSLVSGTSGVGILGYATATSGQNYGVFGQSDSTNGYGIYGAASNTSGQNYGVYGKSDSSSGIGVYGLATSSTSLNFPIGVYGQANSPSGIGVGGYASANSGTNYAVYALSTNPNGYAGYFDGLLHTTNNFTAGGTKSFIIDHPLDPENQYLYHYSMEGPEPYNIYRGTVELDENGSAWVQLPDYFESINVDYNYQLTPIGAPMPNLYIAETINNNKFLISGGEAGKQVSWQVTAIRNDPWVQDQNLQAEVPKPQDEVGTFIYPQGFGLSEEFSVNYNLDLMAELELQP